MSKHKFHLLFDGFLVVLIVIGIAMVITRYTKEINAANEKLTTLSSQVIDTSCGPIEFAQIGEGYPVMVIHGTLGGFDQGLMLANQVIDKDFQVISVSRFGYLRSPLPESANLNKQADAYACLLDALDIKQVTLFAFSGGANSAIRFAARYPERLSSLVLLSPAAPGKISVPPPPKAVPALMRSNFAYWVMVTYFRPMMQKMIGVPEGFILNPEDESVVTEILVTTLPSNGRVDGFIFDNFTSTPEFLEETSENSPFPISEIDTPVLFINAKDDPLAVHDNVRSLSDLFPNSKLFILSNGGHPLLGHTIEVKMEIKKFINDNLTDSYTILE